MKMPDSFLQLVNQLTKININKKYPMGFFYWQFPTGILYVDFIIHKRGYFQDTRFCFGNGEVKIAEIELSQTDVIESLGINWTLLEQNIHEYIEEDIKDRDKNIEHFSKEIEKLKQTNRELEELLVTHPPDDALAVMAKAENDLEESFEEQTKQDKRARKFVRED